MPFEKGHSGNPKGRPAKAEEQKLVERLGPMEEIAHKKLKSAIESGEQWAIKMYFEYMYGRPTSRTEITGKDGASIDFASFIFPPGSRPITVQEERENPDYIEGNNVPAGMRLDDPSLHLED